MGKLDSCPFHKEPIEPNILQGFDQGNGNPGSGGFWATVECPDCGNGFTAIECSTPDDALELVIGQWHTRYKRVCKMPMYHGEDADDDLPAYYRNFKCNACGEVHSRYKYDSYKFCPNCGAEVVDGD